MIDLKRKALAKFLECDADPDELIVLDRIESGFLARGAREYQVLTDEEADARAREYILDSVWGFDPDFLASHSVDGVEKSVIEAIQANGKHESNNPVLRRLLRDEDHFVKDAVRADGRGHFLSPYDGDEQEAHAESEQGERITLYIYRIN